MKQYISTLKKKAQHVFQTIRYCFKKIYISMIKLFMKGNLLLIVLLLFCFNLFSQVKPAIYYFDNDLKLSTKSKSTYLGEGKWDNNLFRLDLYNKKDHYLIFSAQYADSTLSVMDGIFISYYKNGNVENLNYYKKGKPDGVWVKWNLDHKLMDTAWYKNGEPDSSVNYYYDYINRKLLYIIKDNFIDGSTIRTRFDDHEQPLPRDITDSIKVGEDIVVTNPDEEVAFPGSDTAMNDFFQYQFEQQKFELILRGTSGACSLKFKVDKNGNASDFETIYCDNNYFANTMRNAIQTISWLPATKNGKPVAAIKEVSEEFYPSIVGITKDKQRKYYFDDNFNPVESDEAKYFGKITSENNLIKLTVHNNLHHYYENTYKVFSIHFTDSTLQTCSGEFESFYSGDHKKVRGNFLLGKKNGLWLEWDNVGQIVDSALYSFGAKTSETFIGYQPEGDLGIKVMTDYANGKKRTVYYSNRKITSDVTIPLYGKEEGDTNNIFTNPEIAPSFQEGPEAWDKYINEYVNKNLGNHFRDGVCVVRFIVNTDGKISDAEALTLKGTQIAKTIRKGVMSAPDWIPATQDGKKVKAYVILPMRYYFIKFPSTPVNKNYIHPFIINSVKKVDGMYNPN